MADGHIVFQGAASESSAYFEKAGMPIPEFTNPADFFMRELSVHFPKTPEEEIKIASLVSNY